MQIPLIILPRGPVLGSPSMAAAQTGALVQGEASKYPALALNAAEFRHGPMEMIQKDLTVMVLAGSELTLPLNRRLAVEISRLGGRVVWVGSSTGAKFPAVKMPSAKGVGLPIAEMAPFQMLSLALAQQLGVEAGKFFHSGKITLTE